MRRTLLAVAVLLTITASPTFAGYLIIRVLLEGSTPGNTPAPGGIGPGPGPGGGPTGPTLGGSGKGSLGGPPPAAPPGMPPGGMPPGPGGPANPATQAAEYDHARSVVVVLPLESGLLRGRLDMSRPFNPQTNPEFRRFVVPHEGKRLQASLFVDSTSIQLYEELIDKPAAKKTRFTEMKDRHAAWSRDKKDPQLLYDAVVLALESGFIRDRSFHKDNSPPEDAVTYAEELWKVASEKKLTLPADVQRFVGAWDAMREAVLQPAPQQSNAEIWRAQLDAKNVRVEGHYAVISWDSPDAEVTRRLDQLNDNFTGFFLWHATRGIVLKPPLQPQIVVLAILVKDGRDHMTALRAALDGYEGLPSQSDGFYSPEHNIVVLAPQRMDDIGRTFLRQMNQTFSTGLNRDELLSGKIPHLDLKGKGPRPDDVARATTLAVVEKLAVDESEMTAVSREGTRQLLFATNALPKNVTLPHWLTQGTLNFFTRPQGPAYVTKGDNDKPYMSVAFTTGYGVPNYVLHRYFKDMGVHKELNQDPVKLLDHILTDAYFAGLKDGIDPDPAPPAKKKPAGTVGMPPVGPGPGPGPGGLPPGPGGLLPGPGMPPGPGPGLGNPGVTITGDSEDPVVTQRKKKDRLNIKSQATAWALYYYLARGRSAELKQYLAELNKLPRDLPIDGQTAHAAFVKVFKLSSTPDGTADPKLVQKFAKDWLDYMTTVPEISIDIPLVVPEPPKNAGNGPGGPGGPPPGGLGTVPRPGGN